jgi:flagellar biosynthesis protein FlhF
LPPRHCGPHPRAPARARQPLDTPKTASLECVGTRCRPAGRESSVGEELRSLRGLLEQQLAALAWNDFTRREPLKARALTELANLGLDRSLAQEIVNEMPATLSAEQSQRLPYALLARRLKVCEPPVERSGAIAMIGPPGSGKTTTLSKLAARYVLEHDAANLVLISADDERLGRTSNCVAWDDCSEPESRRSIAWMK